MLRPLDVILTFVSIMPAFSVTTPVPLDTLVFTAGIGQNGPVIRARICEGLRFLGIELDNQTQKAELISTSASHVAVRVIRTDEEFVIAKSVCRFSKGEFP